MSIETHIFIAASKGETCILPECERDIPVEEGCIKIKFSVNILGIAKKEVIEAMHYDCAGKFYLVLGQRLGEMQKLTQGRR